MGSSRPTARPQRRRRVAASALVLALLFAASCVTHAAPPLVRIPLENYDQMQFFATVHVGGQPFRVIFDTGSSDIWVPSDACRACAGLHRYTATNLSPRMVEDGVELVPAGDEDDEASDGAFTLQYGSGVVKGVAMRETLRLGEGLELHDARIGSVHEQGSEIQRFQTEGVVGLGMDLLARVSTPGLHEMLRDSEDYRLPMVFSLYLNPFPTASPPSQLIFGGVDEALAGASATWHHFPVVDDPYSSAFGFWSLHLYEMGIQAKPAGEFTALDTLASPGELAGPSRPVAIVDSGTSLILLPSTAYDAAIKAMQNRLGARFRNHSQRSGGFSCRKCDHSEFPAISFVFNGGSIGTSDHQRFVLQGSDYVRCENRVCSPQLDVSSSEMVILGDVFLRAYYTVFDHDNKQIGFACPHGSCEGGIKPPLALNTGFAQLADLGIVYLRSSLLVVIAMASLWFASQLHAWLGASVVVTRRTSRSVDKRRGSVLPEKPEKPTCHATVVEIMCVDAAVVSTREIAKHAAAAGHRGPRALAC